MRLEDLSKLRMLHEINEDGILKVDLDDGHSVGWDVESTCDDCFFFMKAISALPELVHACLEIADDARCGKVARRLAIAALIKIEAE